MGYLNDQVPADTEAVRLGASRIRGLQTSLNTVLAKIFNSTGNFLTGWVLPGHLAADSVTAANIATGSIGSSALAPGSVVAAALGVGSVTAAALGVGSVTAAALGAGSVTATALGAGSVTAEKLAPGVGGGNVVVGAGATTAVGFYPGSAGTISVTSLSFAPQVLMFVKHNYGGVGMAFLAEATGEHSPLHPPSGSSLNVVEWLANGFRLDHCTGFNEAGQTYYYLALKA